MPSVDTASTNGDIACENKTTIPKINAISDIMPFLSLRQARKIAEATTSTQIKVLTITFQMGIVSTPILSPAKVFIPELKITPCKKNRIAKANTIAELILYTLFGKNNKVKKIKHKLTVKNKRSVGITSFNAK